MLFLNLLKNAWKQAEQHKTSFIWIYGLSMTSMCLYLAKPYLWGQFFNGLQLKDDQIFRNAFILVSVLITIHFIHIFLWQWAGFLSEKLAFTIRKNMTRNLYSIFKDLPMTWHIENHSGEVISRINKGISGLSEFPNTQPRYVKYFSRFVGPVILLAIFSWQVSLVAFVLGLLIIFLMIRIDNKKAEYYRQANKKEHVFSTTFLDIVTNIKTIKTLRLGKMSERALLKSLDNVWPLLLKVINFGKYKWTVFDLGAFTTTSLVVIFYVWITLDSQDDLLIGNVYIVYEYMKAMQEVFLGVGKEYEILLKMDSDFQEIKPIIHQKDHRKITLSKRKKIFNNIAIRDLNFKYKNSSRSENLHISDLSMHITSGQKIALIGESGSGKSTLLGILSGLFQAESGYAEIDGTKVSFDEFSKFVTLLPQDPEIFEQTIGYNISMGLNVTKKAIQEAVDLSRFSLVLSKLPRGFMTSIKEKGVNLSGGEKQRLALARGIIAMKTSPLILLDEATSSVDSDNEIFIYQKLFQKFKDHTIIVSTHKLYFLDMFDYIYILCKGKIIEEGSFSDLKEKGKVLKKLLKKTGGIS